MEPSKVSSTASFTDQVDDGAESTLAFPRPDVPTREPDNDVHNKGTTMIVPFRIEHHAGDLNRWIARQMTCGITAGKLLLHITQPLMACKSLQRRIFILLI